MSQDLSVYPSFDALKEDIGLQFDQRSKFFVRETGNIVAIRRTLFASLVPVPHSEDGTFGPGVYVGNNEGSVASFAKIPSMRTVVAVDIPCTPEEVTVINKPRKFSRETFEAQHHGSSDFLVWNPGIGNHIGSIIMGGLKIPKNPMWGLWTNELAPVMAFAEIRA